MLITLPDFFLSVTHVKLNRVTLAVPGAGEPQSQL